MKHKILLALSLLTVSSTLLYGNYFKHIGLSEGLTQPSVMAIYQDRLGRMWFGTREGLNRYDGNQIVAYKGWYKTSAQQTPIWLGNYVSAIQENKKGDVFFLADNDLFKYDIHTELLTQLTSNKAVQALKSTGGGIWYASNDSILYYSDTQQSSLILKTGITAAVRSLTLCADKICIGTTDGIYLIDRTTHRRTHLLKGIEIYEAFETSHKQLWIGTHKKGLYIMDKDGTVTKADISSEQIREFIEDNEHNIWFGSFDGLWKYDHQARRFSLTQIPKYAGGLAHPSIFALYKDRLGIVWVGSYFGGVNYFNPQQNRFAHYDYEQNAPRKLYYSYVGEMVQDKDQNLWISTDGGGVCCLDKEWNIIHQFSAGRQGMLPHNNIKSICYDEQRNHLYMGTHLGGLTRYDITTGMFRYYHKRSETENAPNEVVYHTKMWKGQLYISALNGFFRLNPATDTFERINLPFGYYVNFDIDPDGYVYLASSNYITCFSIYRPQHINKITISKGRISHIRATDYGVYIATLGNGVFFFDKQTHQTLSYTAENKQLPTNYCYNIGLTTDGKVLLTDSKGVTCYDPQLGTFTTIDMMSNFPSTHIIEGCGILTTADKRVFIADTKGFTSFEESELTTLRNSRSSLFFSELWVNNQSIHPGDDTRILAQSLPYTKELKLKHNQNNLIIHFALPDFHSGLSKDGCQYKLDGFDEQWISTKQTELHYTNLSPGSYALHVSTTDGAPKRTTLLITIASPWYDTWWAWTLYIILATSISYAYFLSRMAKQRLRFSLEKERFEKQHIEKTNQEKLVFFTNVSHEFRTPLTLIISHIDLLLQNNSFIPLVYDQLLKIKKNARQLNTLITELLEFRKLEQKQEPLELQQADFRTLLQETYLSFVDYARQRNIDYTFHLPDSPFICLHNAHLMEKVFFELLSNAFKYTPDNTGKISLTGSLTSDRLKIRIHDNGIGIPEEDLPMIFAPFFEGSNGNDRHTDRTGIGLALAKSIVERHHGHIFVQSTVGEGSIFTIELPTTADRPAPEEPTTPCTDKEHTLLLVEDNEELLLILHDLFSPFYTVVCAGNGIEGLERTRTHKPDLIVSDIMMPQMNGTEMCSRIKSDIALCHTPIILLTALGSIEHNIEGLNQGADAYVTKPFNAQLLLAQAGNIVRNRILVRRQFNKKPISEIDLSAINPLDKELLMHASEIIERNIDNTEFDISVLAEELLVSRSTLFNKFKALTDMTPNNYILNYRLKHAASMLKEQPDMLVAEVSDRCGFNTHVHFGQCFKKLFGCTPQQYRLP